MSWNAISTQWTSQSIFSLFQICVVTPEKDGAVEGLQKQIDDIVKELNLLKEQQALQTGRNLVYSHFWARLRVENVVSTQICVWDMQICWVPFLKSDTFLYLYVTNCLITFCFWTSCLWHTQLIKWSVTVPPSLWCVALINVSHLHNPTWNTCVAFDLAYNRRSCYNLRTALSQQDSVYNSHMVKCYLKEHFE